MKKVARKKVATKTPAFRGGVLGSDEKLKESLAKSSGQNFFWTLADGVTAVVRFLTEPRGWVEFWQHWDDDTKNMYTCSGRDNGCTYCEEGVRSIHRYAAAVVDKSEMRVRVIVLPVSAVDVLHKRLNKNKTITDRDYEITRDGTGKDNTSYDVDSQPPKYMNPKKFDIPDVTAMVASQLPGASAVADDDDDEDFLPTKKKGVKKARPTIADDDDDDDDEPPRRRLPIKKAVKSAVKKKKLR